MAYRSRDDLTNIREQVCSQAALQGGVFRRETLVTWGVDPEVAPAMLRRKWWIRLRHGVYSDSSTVAQCAADPRGRHLLDAAAALAALPRSTHLFSTTAAALHGLPVDRGLFDEVQLIRERGADVRSLHRRVANVDSLPAVRLRTHSLRPQWCTVHEGLPTVGPELAAVSAAARGSHEAAVVILDAAAWARPDALVAFTAMVDDWPLLKGIGTVRRALPLARTGAQTPLESLSRLRLLAAGLPEPSLQVPLYDAAGLIGYVDMAWLDRRVVGEADGAVKYETRDDLLREKAREDRIRALGFIVVRWTWNEIISNPGSVAARVRGGMSRAARRAG